MTDADGLIELLTRRHGLLSILIDEPMERHELVPELGASKSTVYKGIGQLEMAGLLESTADGIRPTPFGREVHRRYGNLARIVGLRDLLTELPTDAPLDSAAPAGATGIVPDSQAIDRPFVYIEELLGEADSLQGFTPVISPRYVSIFHERLLDGGFEAELLFETDMIETFEATESESFEASADDIVTNDAVTIWRADAALPFGLVVAQVADSERMVLEVRADGSLRGLLVNGTPESVQWARETILNYQQDATRVETAHDLR